MKIAYLGAGTWGFCLASLLAQKGYEVRLWTANPEFSKLLAKKREHPKLPRYKAPDNLVFTSDLRQALEGAEILIESVTSKGIRPVFEQVLALGGVSCPIVVTSKGIEQNSGLLLPEIVLDVLGESSCHQIGCLSGPSHAEEVIQHLPSSVVSAAFDPKLAFQICELFNTPFFRVYPNKDLPGVAFGGAMKNIIAIACGIADGLGFGDNTKAALMTRGLHEIRKLSVTKGCQPETLNGLAGMGDLCVTCLSKLSRNYMFGRLIAEGFTPDAAREKIGMVVEGAYTTVSAKQLGEKAHIDVPITQAVYTILYEGMNPRDAVKILLQRAIKEEHL
ncbi:MAG: NAD(P)-dependent glycerol-3-phosphate dehydrogenase [Anaplasmataceae bacterium]|nr:NAD(P)-dependent glycerol-3-phosphate dehydrogenase [Anaplasmataceae bacterium]